MFPTVRCSFSNLRPDQKYWVLLDIVPCDNKRYRYAYHRSSWLVAGKADPAPPHRLYPHPDAPYTGDQLRKQVVSFETVVWYDRSSKSWPGRSSWSTTLTLGSRFADVLAHEIPEGHYSRLPKQGLRLRWHPSPPGHLRCSDGGKRMVWQRRQIMEMP